MTYLRIYWSICNAYLLLSFLTNQQIESFVLIPSWLTNKSTLQCLFPGTLPCSWWNSILTVTFKEFTRPHLFQLRQIRLSMLLATLEKIPAESSYNLKLQHQATTSRHKVSSIVSACIYWHAKPEFDWGVLASLLLILKAARASSPDDTRILRYHRALISSALDVWWLHELLPLLACERWDSIWCCSPTYLTPGGCTSFYICWHSKPETS